MTSPGRRTGRLTRGVVQPALPLGYAEVHWDALPVSVREEVLTRWCELLSLVAADPRQSSLDLHDGDVEEQRP
jgi:hypothetical protein